MIPVLLLLVVVAAAFLLNHRIANENSRSLEQHLPLWKVEHDCIISKQGDVTIGYEVHLPEIFTLSSDDFEALHQVWVKAFKVLPAHTIVHKQDFYNKDAYAANFEQDQSFLARQSELFFHERPFLQHSCYLYITKKPAGRKPSNLVINNLLRSRLTPSVQGGAATMQALLDAVGQFEKILLDGGAVRLTRLSEKDLIGDEAYPGVIEKYLFASDLHEPLSVKDIQFHPEFKIGDRYCQMFTLGDVEVMPPLCGPRINYDRYSTDKTKFSISFAAPVNLLLNCNHVYNQYIMIGDAQKTLKEMESRKLRLQSLSGYSRKNAMSRDATNDFLNEAIGDQRMPIKAHFNVLYWTEQRSELKDLRNLVSSGLAQMDATPREESKAAAQLFWAGIPGNAADFPVSDTFDTFLEQACCFLNVETNYRTSLSATGFRLGDRITGYPLHVDISDEMVKRGYCQNRNKFLLAGSGSGKSFFCCHLLRSYYELGTHIVVVDVGHSYRGLCTMLQGYYFTYEEANPITFNPFYIGQGETLDTEKKESIKTLLLALWKKDNETYRRSEYVALSNSLTLYFEYLELHPNIFPCFNSFYEYLRDEYLDVLVANKVQEKDFDASNFMYVLRPYYQGGEFDYLLNATSNLDLLQKRFIVFELDNIKDHPILFPVVTLIIMETFISKMRKLKGIRKMILIEEAWKAIAKEGMAEYIKYLFKTVRKFFGEAIVVTQEVEDIISSPIIKQAIINNSDVKILLDQSKYQNKFGLIQEMLGLTDKQKTEILSLNKSNEPGRKYKEVWFGFGGFLSKVYRVEVSKAEYYAYTTEESEKVLVQQYTDRYGGDIQRGIAALVADLEHEQKRM
ncbi:Bacteroides conjugation system ATPase, TraG family [Chitinophaga costaii]|uniref:Bacteroides conjugation system ATPase, TraG family n=1 Tax=Chitinophaga costaii TaxID=1335309 RepID=A0A1C4EWY4_9BACT|nr:TraG family conjugative transposon ATPase [Chitinophaga costaii]PUZ21593.1 TraG family conjugative transposon ATPase [Chitinophaga costaii]SCC48006.1 Bacteroides conjugation system ATPase, TraG family [Chitinophaga costaii]